MRPRHRLIGVLIIQQRQHFAHDPRAVRADQPGGARLYAFGPFGRLAHHQHRLAQRRRFLLHPAAVGQHQVAHVEQPHEMRIIQRFDHRDIGQRAQHRIHHRADIGIGMDREHHRHVRARGDVGDGARDRLHAAAEILAPVRRHRDDPLARKARRERIEPARQRRIGAHPVARRQQRVDHRVAGDVNGGRIAIFLAQRVGCRLRRREIHVGDAGDDAAVDLLGPGMMNVAAAQPRLDMGDRDLAIIGRQARHHRRQRVAMHDHPVGLFGVERAAQLDDQLRGQPVQRLVGHHHVQVDVGRDPGDRQHLVQQPAMLGGDDHARLHPAAPAQRMHHREHLDRLGTGPEHHGHLHALLPRH